MHILKKIGKIIGIILLILLALVILFLTGTTIMHNVKEKKNLAFMEEKGYYHPVSVGDRTLNVLISGEKDGAHRIILMSGAGAGFPLETANLSEKIGKENQVIYVARPGFDGSDDAKEDITVSFVVENYRKALENAGIQKPYILMPHSLGSIYAAYWVSKYPDEIEAMVDIDGVCPHPYTDAEIQQETDEAAADLSFYKMVRHAIRLGIVELDLRGFMSANPAYSEDEQRILDTMQICTFEKKAIVSEGLHNAANYNDTWNALQPNDVPKLYICASNAYKTAEELEQDDVLQDDRIEYFSEGYTGSEDGRRAYAFQKYLEECERVREDELKPFAEKLGNCKIEYLPGDHHIFNDRPEECEKIILDFINGLA